MIEKHAMFDCETLGVGNHPILLSLACVIFDEDGRSVDTYHRHIDVKEDQFGAKFSGSTVLWWMGQSEEARGAILAGQKNPDSFYASIYGLHNFFEEHKVATVWSYGARADLTWIDNALNTVFDKNPCWTYRQERCLRTVGAIFDPESEMRPKPTIAHDALADAQSQVAWLTNMAIRNPVFGI